jgi:acyl-coenzyme A thioesterase PaaI-like protein
MGGRTVTGDSEPAGRRSDRPLELRRRDPNLVGGEDYARLIDTLRGFLDQVAGAAPSVEQMKTIESTLAQWSEELAPNQVPEDERWFGRRGDLPGRGQTMSPRLDLSEFDGSQLRGTVRFGRYFLGYRAVHGGSIPMVFDELLGQVAAMPGGRPARTAYLHVNYRSVTPIDRDLDIVGRLVRVEGRKRFVTAELYDGATLCADAEGLFVELKPGQP